MQGGMAKPFEEGLGMEIIEGERLAYLREVAGKSDTLKILVYLECGASAGFVPEKQGFKV